MPTDKNELMGVTLIPESPSVISFDDLRQCLSRCGFDAELAREMLPRNAFARSARELSDKRIIRKVREDDAEIEFQFTREWLDSGEFRYAKECSMLLHKEHGTVRGTDTELCAVAQKLVNEHTAKRNRTDVTMIIKKLFRQRNGDFVPLRKDGGVYFVPNSHSDLADRVTELVRQLGGSMGRFPMFFGDPDASGTIAEKMTDHLLDLVQQWKESCQIVTSETSECIVERRSESHRKLKQKMESYKSLLGTFGDRVAAALDAGEAFLLQQLTATTPTTPTAPVPSTNNTANDTLQLAFA